MLPLTELKTDILIVPQLDRAVGNKSAARAPFSIFLCAFGLFLISTCVFFLLPPRASSCGYYGSIRDKHQRLKIEKPPRIIFVGGSNLAYGLDSNMIETEFHRPVINMGLAAPFGLPYMLEEVKDDICAGDTIVLVIESDLLQEGRGDGGPDLLHAVEVNAPSFNWILRALLSQPMGAFKILELFHHCCEAKWAAFVEMAKDCVAERFNFSPVAHWRLKSQIGGVLRTYFTKQGDYVGHFGKPIEDVFPSPSYRGKFSTEAAQVLNAFALFAEKRGAHVVLIPPPLPSDTYGILRNKIAGFYDHLAKDVEVQILASPDRYALPRADFYQPPHHLGAKGRTERTRLIVQDLKCYFQNQTPLRSL